MREITLLISERSSLPCRAQHLEHSFRDFQHMNHFNNSRESEVLLNHKRTAGSNFEITTLPLEIFQQLISQASVLLWDPTVSSSTGLDASNSLCGGDVCEGLIGE